MYTELMCLERDMTDREVAEGLETAKKYNLDGIIVLPSLLPAALDSAPDANIGVAVDYPYGSSDHEVRLLQAEMACAAGAKFIGLTANHKCLLERQYASITSDAVKIQKRLAHWDASLRIFLEYKLFENQTLSDLCHALRTVGIETVYPSTGSMIDNFMDNLVISRQLQKQKTNVISNSRITVPDQLSQLDKHKVHGVAFYSAKVLSSVLAGGV